MKWLKMTNKNVACNTVLPAKFSTFCNLFIPLDVKRFLLSIVILYMFCPSCIVMFQSINQLWLLKSYSCEDLPLFLLDGFSVLY